MAERERARDVTDAGRRRFLTIGIGGLGSALVAATLGPAVVTVAYPLRHATTSGTGGFVPVGRADGFAEGVPRKVELFSDVVDAYNRFEHQKVGSAWIVRHAGTLVALSTVCPHLGCAIDWSARDRCFACPCHRSSFGLDGKRRSGPSPRDMDRLALHLTDHRVEVLHQRFRQGIVAKVPV
jgi:Rieske Fe-S protein